MLGQLFVYFQLYIDFSQISQLEASTVTLEFAQGRDVWNEYLEFLLRSAISFLSAVILLLSNKQFRGFKVSNTETA